MLSAYLTFGAVLAAYLFGQVDPSLLNVVDTQVFRVRPYRPPLTFTRKGQPTRLRIHDALRQAILALSDQQIVTGIAIMGAGFQGLRLGGIDGYHYQIILYLAWMSSSVHLSALSLLAPFLNKRPALKAWRLVGMLVLLVLLLVGLVPTISNDWGLLTWTGMKPGNTGWGVPAICFFGKTWGDGANPDAVLGFLLLAVSYAWKVGALFQRPRHVYFRWVRHPIAWAFETLVAKAARQYHESDSRQQPTKRLCWLWLYRSTLVFWVPAIAVLETLASFSAAIWISMGGLIFGTIQIFIPRFENYQTVGSQEGQWGFGQLVPLILLIQPLGALWEHVVVYERGRDQEDDEVSSAAGNTTSNHRLLESQRSDHANRGPVGHKSRPYLLEYLAENRPSPIELRTSQRNSSRRHTTGNLALPRQCPLDSTRDHCIYNSNLHCCAFSIGYTTSGNWVSISMIVGGYIGAAWIMTFLLAPWSCIGSQLAKITRPGRHMDIPEEDWRGKPWPSDSATEMQHMRSSESDGV